MYTRTIVPDASPRAQALSHEISARIKESRSRDPSLGVADALVALELAKTSLLEESGVPFGRRQTAVVAAVVLAALVAGVAFFAMSP